MLINYIEVEVSVPGVRIGSDVCAYMTVNPNTRTSNYSPLFPESVNNLILDLARLRVVGAFMLQHLRQTESEYEEEQTELALILPILIRALPQAAIAVPG